MIKAHFNKIRSELIKEITASEKSLKIAVAWFTNNELFEAILSKCKNKIPVELVIINDSINLKKLGLDFNLFIQEGGLLYFGTSETLMHHKFCIIDDNVLINGSYNWTYWAETKNNENITIFREESELVISFNEEFNKIINSKKPIQSIDSYLSNLSIKENDFFDLGKIRIDEYISSAIDLGNRGKVETSYNIFEEVNKINPVKASAVLQNQVYNDNPLFKQIYQTFSAKTVAQSQETSYKDYCKRIEICIRLSKYLDAISLANTCTTVYKNRFSVYVYCGDAKMKLNDKVGAAKEYRTALNFNHQKNSKLLYYNRVYDYSFFPRADIYLKLDELDKVKEVLQDAIRFYTQENIPIDLKKAKDYITKINNNEKLTHIQ